MRCGDLDRGPRPGVARSSGSGRTPGMEGADLASGVSTRRGVRGARRSSGRPRPTHGRVLRVAAYDFGLKRNILRRLAAAGIEATVVPGRDARRRDRSPAASTACSCRTARATRRRRAYGVGRDAGLLGRCRCSGSASGHQLLGLALGGRTYKMPFGHRGREPAGAATAAPARRGHEPQPRVRASTRTGGRGRATSHGRRRGRVELTHWNLNDGTLEGLRCLDVPAFSVQYHPEAAPGPHDSRYLFERFRDADGGGRRCPDATDLERSWSSARARS